MDEIMEVTTAPEETVKATAQETVAQPGAILYGRKTIGFPFIANDLDHFVSLLRADKFGYMGNFCLKKLTDEQAKEYIHSMIITGCVIIWTIYTKEGRASRRAGYAYITDISSFCCEISGIMDMQFARGLTKQLRRDKYTYAEDAMRSLLKFSFEKLGLVRIQAVNLEMNRRSIALQYKVGFKREGVMRRAFDLDGNLVNLQIFSMLKEEYKDG